MMSVVMKRLKLVLGHVQHCSLQDCITFWSQRTTIWPTRPRQCNTNKIQLEREVKSWWAMSFMSSLWEHPNWVLFSIVFQVCWFLPCFMSEVNQLLIILEFSFWLPTCLFAVSIFLNLQISVALVQINVNKFTVISFDSIWLLKKQCVSVVCIS